MGTFFYQVPIGLWFRLPPILLSVLMLLLGLALTGLYIFILSRFRLEEVQALFDRAKHRWQERGLFAARPEDEVDAIA